MAEVILVEGESGVGKSRSLINLKPEENLVLTASDKPLPFPGSAKWSKRIKLLGDMNEIPSIMDQVEARNKENPDKTRIKHIIIEDHTHFQNARILSDKFLNAGASSNKYARWETFGRDVYASVWAKAKELKTVDFVVVIGHAIKDADGTYYFKTFGKMVGNSVDPPSYSRIVLHGVINKDKKGDERHVFITNNDGIHEAKSPEGMFPETIPNDLAAVLKRIKAYDNGEELQPEEATA